MGLAKLFSYTTPVSLISNAKEVRRGTMNTTMKSIGSATFSVMVAIAVAALFVFPTEVSAQDSPSGILEDVPEGANRIIMVQEGASPADVYVEMYNMLVRADFQITTSAENLILEDLEELLDREPLVIQAKKQIHEELALQLAINVDETNQGGQLIASAKYAEDVNASVTQWKQAKWTSGQAKDAFVEAMDVVRRARYDALEYETGVAVSLK